MGSINQLFEHLGISEAFIAAPFPSDIENFCDKYPEKISAICLVAPNEVNNYAFKNYRKKMMVIKSDRGPTHLAASSLKNDLPCIRTFEIKDYEILPWTDISIDHPIDLIENISQFFSYFPCKNATYFKDKTH